MITGCSRRLDAKRVAVLAADGFEMLELVLPVAALCAAGATAEVVSLRRGRIRGVNLHEPGRRVSVSKTLSEATTDGYDALLIPGGFINPDLLRQSALARAFVKDFDASKKPIATLCHGPWLLASAGLLPGRTLTAWPGIRDDVVNAGGLWRDSALVRDGNWITSRGPQDLPAFIGGMLSLFSGSPPVLEDHFDHSSPPRDEPPGLVLSVMKWMPRPSLRGALAVSALGLWALSKSGQRERAGTDD